MKHYLVIEDWEGDGAIRLPDDVLQEMGVDIGSTLYLLEEYVGTTRCRLLSKTPRIPDHVDELVGLWESFSHISPDKRQGRVSCRNNPDASCTALAPSREESSTRKASLTSEPVNS